MLINPQVNKDYIIHCDTSKYSYSGIPQHTRPGTNKFVPVAYFSGNFDKIQVKWNITEMEAMLSINLSRDFHFTSQEPRLQSLVTTSHSEISSKEE